MVVRALTRKWPQKHRLVCLPSAGCESQLSSFFCSWMMPRLRRPSRPRASRLSESSVTSIDQLRELVPSLHVQETPLGNIAQFNIRGIGTSSPDLQFDPGVGIYLDGVFLPRARGSLLNVVDVQQIEVLRG